MTTRFDRVVSTWKGITFHCVTITAGIALAAGSAIALEGSQRGDAKAGTSMNHMIVGGSGTTLRPDQKPQEVYYFVNSLAQADFAAHAEKVISEEESSINSWQPSRKVHVLMVVTEDDEVVALQSIYEAQTLQGRNVLFIDFRGRSLPANHQSEEDKGQIVELQGRPTGY